MSNHRVFFGGLPKSVHQVDLENFLASESIRGADVKEMFISERPSGTIAFVHFKSRRVAELAVRRCHHKRLFEKYVTVEMTKYGPRPGAVEKVKTPPPPPPNRKRHRHRSPVPPRKRRNHSSPRRRSRSRNPTRDGYDNFRQTPPPIGQLYSGHVPLMPDQQSPLRHHRNHIGHQHSVEYMDASPPYEDFHGDEHGGRFSKCSFGGTRSQRSASRCSSPPPPPPPPPPPQQHEMDGASVGGRNARRKKRHMTAPQIYDVSKDTKETNISPKWHSFAQYLSERMEKMTEKQQATARCKIEQALYEAEFGGNSGGGMSTTYSGSLFPLNPVGFCPNPTIN